MNINPVSFGRTIKINMNKPELDSEVFPRLLYLLNTNEPQKYDSADLQKQLKTIFDDTNVGKARPIFLVSEPDGYIVTGETSNKIGEFLDTYITNIRAIRDKYNGHYSDEEKDYFNKHYSSHLEKMEQIIAETKEPQELHVEFDSFHKKINSINLVG